MQQYQGPRKEVLGGTGKLYAIRRKTKVTKLHVFKAVAGSRYAEPKDHLCEKATALALEPRIEKGNLYHYLHLIYLPAIRGPVHPCLVYTAYLPPLTTATESTVSNQILTSMAVCRQDVPLLGIMIKASKTIMPIMTQTLIFIFFQNICLRTRFAPRRKFAAESDKPWVLSPSRSTFSPRSWTRVMF